ncbi:hypothetical protein HOO65_080004 [Ceratocystis lukuohia]|uniref:Uncharacterized protein n=1 Tax=Ceratocystis lukuohia TaxID=2019550 RepID=A0ABR4M9V5_9PEZI
MTTIIDSFYQAIPEVQVSPPLGTSRRTHVSGSSTAYAEAPYLAFHTDLVLWEMYADRILQRLHASDSFSCNYLATWEPCRRLVNEADVADAAAVQLMNPVEMAFCAIHGSRIKSLNNSAAPNRSRADKVWMRYDAVRGWTHFAILDYKKIGTINEDEVFRACVSPSDYHSTVDSQVSLFRGDILTIIKQGVNYSESYETRYIAFFDWDVLLLLYFGDRIGTTGGSWCSLAIITDKRHMRKALLGFLERAYKSSVSGEARLSSIVPSIP